MFPLQTDVLLMQKVLQRLGHMVKQLEKERRPQEEEKLDQPTLGCCSHPCLQFFTFMQLILQLFLLPLEFQPPSPSAFPPPRTSVALPRCSSSGVGQVFSTISTPPFLIPVASPTLTWSTLNLEPPRSNARNSPFSAAQGGRGVVYSTMYNLYYMHVLCVSPPLPDPSGVERTCVGSIFNAAAALLSTERPFFISAWKRAEMSLSWSSWRCMAYRNLST